MSEEFYQQVKLYEEHGVEKIRGLPTEWFINLYENHKTHIIKIKKKEKKEKKRMIPQRIPKKMTWAEIQELMYGVKA